MKIMDLITNGHREGRMLTTGIFSMYEINCVTSLVVVYSLISIIMKFFVQQHQTPLYASFFYCHQTGGMWYVDDVSQISDCTTG
jgi:hypothetical protein